MGGVQEEGGRGISHFLNAKLSVGKNYNQSHIYQVQMYPFVTKGLNAKTEEILQRILFLLFFRSKTVLAIFGNFLKILNNCYGKYLWRNYEN